MECRRGHPPGVFLRGNGDECGVCISCFAAILTDPSVLITHKAFAVATFSQCLEDEVFCSDFLCYHPHSLVESLSESVSLCKDQDLSKATVQLILDICRLTVEENSAVLDDFIFRFSDLLSGQVMVSSRAQCHMLHAMGILLELHSKVDNAIPRAIESLMENLVATLELPGDEIKGEVVFLMYKIASLEGGIENMISFCPRITTLVVTSLLKTESNELRTNCLALLTVFVRNSIFDLNVKENEDSPEDFEFIAVFCGAIKGSLLSSDIQVQLSSLQLICHLCSSQDFNMSKGRILVEEGVADYVFEILRVSDDVTTLATLAVRTLTILSAAKSVFSQRLMFGIEAIVRVLEHLMDSPAWSVQTDCMTLLTDGLTEYPGIVNSANADRIYEILSKILQKHTNLVQDAECFETSSTLSYTTACLAMISLVKVPAFRNIPSAPERVSKSVTNVLTVILHDRNVQPVPFRYSLRLLQELLTFEAKCGDITLFKAFEEILPYLAKVFESSEEEDTVEAILSSLTTIMRTTAPKAERMNFTTNLARKRWLTLAFACAGRFRSAKYKEVMVAFVAGMVDLLADVALDENVLRSFLDIPTDPDDLLILLEQSSAADSDLAFIHSAIIRVLYTSYVHNDRLVEEGQLLASLEQFILQHGPAFHLYSEYIEQLVTLYGMARSTATAAHSMQAESLLVTTVQQSGSTLVLLSSKTQPFVRDWLLSQEVLKTVLIDCVFQLFHESQVEAICGIIENENGAALVVSLLQKSGLDNVEKDIEVITSILTDILQLRGGHFANYLHQQGIISAVRHWYVLFGSGATVSTLASLLELLCQLLLTLTAENYPRNDSFKDVVNQTVYLLLRPRDIGLDASMLAFICLVSYRSFDLSFLSETAHEIYTNKDLPLALKERLTGFANQFSLTNHEEQILCLCLLFQLLTTDNISLEDLSRIGSSFSGLPRVFSSWCMLERFLKTTNVEFTMDPCKFKSMVLHLQASVLDDNEMVQMNASGALVSLLKGNFLTIDQRKIVEQSPWNCFLAKELLTSCTQSLSFALKMELLIALLKVQGRHNWLRKVFSSSNITVWISSLSVEQLSCPQVCLSLELLCLECLDSEHIRALSDLFQCFRRAYYKRSVSSSQGVNSAHNLEDYSKVAGLSSYSVCINLVVSFALNSAHSPSVDVVGKIDEFLCKSRQGNNGTNMEGCTAQANTPLPNGPETFLQAVR